MNLEQLADDCGTDKGSHQGFMSYYAKHLPLQQKPVILCEFGVHTGASLRMWAKYYFHINTRIIGLDVNIGLYERINDPRVEVYKADCTSRDAATILAAMRPPDIIIDDASHEGPDVTKAFEAWWPELQPGGLYVVEDTHCSYNTDHYRSAGPPGTMYAMMEFLKLLADDANWGIHGYDRFTPMFKDIASIHFYPGICFIEKRVA